MSADNGYVLRRNEDEKFVLQYYIASADTLPPINAPSALVFDSVEGALDKYEEFEESEYPTEYGLTVRIKEVTTS